jgi:hypothetical protein
VQELFVEAFATDDGGAANGADLAAVELVTEALREHLESTT